MSATNEGRRIFIWSSPRSISTAFMRCFMNLGDNCKALFEPFLKAYYFGEERLSDRYAGSDIMPNARFSDIKSRLQEPYEGYDYVVIKDFGYYLRNRTHLLESLPDEYIYIFLIRHPAKTITSQYKTRMSGELDGWAEFHPYESSYKELPEIYRIITKKMGVAPVLVDADDLLENPEKMLKQICSKTGLTYCDSMLHWKPVTEEQMEEFNDWIPFVKTMLENDGLKQKPVSPPPDVSNLPAEVQQAINEALPFYQELYNLRLKL